MTGEISAVVTSARQPASIPPVTCGSNMPARGVYLGALTSARRSFMRRRPSCTARSYSRRRMALRVAPDRPARRPTTAIPRMVVATIISSSVNPRLLIWWPSFSGGGLHSGIAGHRVQAHDAAASATVDHRDTDAGDAASGEEDDAARFRLVALEGDAVGELQLAREGWVVGVGGDLVFFGVDDDFDGFLAALRAIDGGVEECGDGVGCGDHANGVEAGGDGGEGD